MFILGINCLGPNTAACLLEGGRLVAMAEEERFNRIKTAPDKMPIGAIRYCLDTAGIRLADVSYMALGWNLSIFPDVYRRRARENFPPMTRRDEIVTDMVCLLYDEERVRDELRFALRAAGIDDPIPELIQVPHHLCHAAATFFNSGFADGLILTVDGSGELLTTALWHGSGRDVKRPTEWEIPNSLGWFYAALTEYMGFRAYSGEGKLMGLAPYGKPDPEIGEKLRKLVKLTPDGFEVDSTFIYFGPHAHRARFTDRLVELLGEPHNPAHGEYAPRLLSVAFETQRLLEEAVTHLARIGFAQVETRNLTVSGGVAMNCKMNGVLARLPEVENFYVFPGANDGGTALGAALWACKEVHAGDPRRCGFDHAYWGPEFSNGEIRDVLDSVRVSYETPPDVAEVAAEALECGSFVGWFQGRMEYGARALGNRSILADPSHPGAKDRLNAQVKFREGFRPFRPSVLADTAEEWVREPLESPYMMVAFEATEKMASRAPAVVHVDGSIRPQFVKGPENPRYRDLIQAFARRTSLPLVLDTSFNVRGEPIVCTPLEAMRCFAGTGLDLLVLGDFVLRKGS